MQLGVFEQTCFFQFVRGNVRLRMRTFCRFHVVRFTADRERLVNV